MKMAGRRGQTGAGRSGNILLALALTLFIFTAAVVLVLNFRWLYYIDITLLGIQDKSGMTVNEIRANYDALIQYNQFWYHGELKFPTLIMSNTGRIHFQEVKRIFVVIQYLCMGSGLASLAGMIRHARRHNLGYLRITGILSLGIPVALGVLAAANWDRFFVTFHHIFFRNDYWLFDSKTDPVILILPDAYFLHCAVLILLLILLGSLLCFWIYRHRRRAAAARKRGRRG